LTLICAGLIAIASPVTIHEPEGQDKPLTLEELNRRSYEEIQEFNGRFKADLESDLRNGLSPEERQFLKGVYLSKMLKALLLLSVLPALGLVATRRNGAFRSFSITIVLGVILLNLNLN
jgi:hypothetical protein